MARRGITDYPVGATWKGEDLKTGRRATIWLYERSAHLEVWRYSWCYPDGSTSFPSSDWGMSYRMCKESLPFDCRMKRVK